MRTLQDEQQRLTRIVNSSSSVKELIEILDDECDGLKLIYGDPNADEPQGVIYATTEAKRGKR